MKFTKEQRRAIIKKVTNLAKEEYEKRVNEAKSKYVPSEKYKALEQALYDREKACEIIKDITGSDSWKTEPIDIKHRLNSFMERELKVKQFNINEDDLETEILLSECEGIEELISHLLELVSKNNNN